MSLRDATTTSHNRLTDEQVADCAKPDSNYLVGLLAREVERDRALRPDCPTCHGDKVVRPFSTGAPCPDCTDGKMPLDKWVALLVETLRSLRTDFAADGYPTVAYVPTIDAVLKMVPKNLDIPTKRE